MLRTRVESLCLLLQKVTSRNLTTLEYNQSSHADSVQGTVNFAVKVKG